jgi:hypothetical protein
MITGMDVSLVAWLNRIITRSTEPMVTPRYLTGAPSFKPFRELSK